MILQSVRILGYKSINEIEFSMERCNGSFTKILLGKNGTGKSNILSALTALDLLKNETPVNFYKVQNQQYEPDRVEVVYCMKPETQDYQAYIAEQVDVSEEILKLINIISAYHHVAIDREDNEYGEYWTFEYLPICFNDIVYRPASNNQVAQLKRKEEVPEEQRDEYTPFSKELFEENIEPLLEQWCEKYEVQVIYWKPDPQYLVENEVSLKEFAENISKYPLVRNIFRLIGIDTKDAIENKILAIERNSSLRVKLQRVLSRETTAYLNKKWKEHNDISIEVSIDSKLNLLIKVQDKDKDDNFYDMEDRSEGFKHFVSLLLTLSTDNDKNVLKNKLILIDEPENHLHPSGIRDMLQELLKIGQNNYVFVSTHSDFMLDHDARERHYIVSKKCGETNVKHITSDTDLNDDEVLQAAFGINVIKDFLSPHKLLVEGASDKNLIYKALGYIAHNNNVRITNGNGSNIVSIASRMAFDSIYPIVILDDDKAGQQMKKEIIKLGQDYSDLTVFTIRDLNGDIISGGTIEDVLPAEWLKNKINEVLHAEGIADFNITGDEPVLHGLIIHIQRETSLNARATKKEKDAQKEKIDKLIESIKTKIAEDYPSEDITENKTPKLHKLASKILNIFNEQ